MDEYTLVIALREAQTGALTSGLRAAQQVAAALAPSGAAQAAGRYWVRLEPAPGLVIVEAEQAEGVVLALARVARSQQALATCLWLGRPRQLQLQAGVWLPRAARWAEAVAVGPGPASAVRREAIAGVLRTYLGLARGRSLAQWATIDAFETAGTQAAAARALRCSRQAVSVALRRAHHHAEADAAAALALLSADARLRAAIAGETAPGGGQHEQLRTLPGQPTNTLAA